MTSLFHAWWLRDLEFFTGLIAFAKLTSYIIITRSGLIIEPLSGFRALDGGVGGPDVKNYLRVYLKIIGLDNRRDYHILQKKLLVRGIFPRKHSKVVGGFTDEVETNAQHFFKFFTPLP